MKLLKISFAAAILTVAVSVSAFAQAQPPAGAPSGPLALNRKRHWVVEGNVLTLTTKADDGKALSVAKWQKVG